MTTEAQFVREENDVRLTADAAIASGEIYQLKSGRAGYKKGLNAAASGDPTAFETEGQVVIPKTANIVILDGGRVYWDHSANAGHFKKVNDRDFYIGRAVGDAASSDTTMTVNLNVDPPYDIMVEADPCISVKTGTAAAGGFGYPVALGGNRIFELTATNEAQCTDLLSVDGFSPAANAIIEGAFRIINDGAGTVVDVSLGVASATSTTDADAIAEHCFLHLDANNTAINAQSKDGTTTVAATDTTKTYTEGTTLSTRKEFWMDMRDPADIQIYIDGVLVLGATVFNLGAAVGPLFLLAHIEKTLSTDTYKFSLDWLRARFGQQ